MKRSIPAAITLAGAGAFSSAGQTAISVQDVDNTAGGPALAGFVTQDITIDFSEVYVGSQLLLTLDTGAIYRDANGNPDGRAPNPVLFPSFPSLEFDSYVGNPAFSSAFSLFAGAVDLGGPPLAEFPSETTGAPVSINQSWSAPDLLPFPQTDFQTARLTLSADATGRWSYLASVGGEITVLDDAPIIDGVLLLAEPEPLVGDYNMDGFVSQADLDLVLLNWGANPNCPPNAFCTEPPLPFFDEFVGQNELDGVLLNWGNGTPLPKNSGGRTAVPEPGSLVVLLGLGGLAHRTRRSAIAR